MPIAVEKPTGHRPECVRALEIRCTLESLAKSPSKQTTLYDYLNKNTLKQSMKELANLCSKLHLEKLPMKPFFAARKCLLCDLLAPVQIWQ